MAVKVKKLYEDAKLPTHGSEKAAGYDLYAYLIDGETEICIPPYETVLIGTGIAIQPPEGCFGAIFARSGLATKQGLRPANCVGVCDYDYTGEYIVPLYNDSKEERIIKNEERVAQVVFIPCMFTDFEEVEDLSETTRGSDGFGSTGNK
jgi:dUTP pyrophosphatase